MTRGRLGRLATAGRFGPVLIASVATMAIAAPWLPLADPTDVDLTARLAPFSMDHLLGTDSNGRDILSRLVWGSRTSLVGPLLVTSLALIVGVALAVVAAWRGGWLDSVISRSFDIVFAFPGILLALLATAMLGRGLLPASVALSVAYTPYLGRVTRSAALQQVRLPYIDALLVQGVSGFAIVVRHVLPNLSRLILAQATVTFGYALVDLAALSFLGLGVEQSVPDWGGMVAGGQSEVIAGHPHQALLAGAVIVIVVMAFTIVGERLADESDDHRAVLL